MQAPTRRDVLRLMALPLLAGWGACARKSEGALPEVKANGTSRFRLIYSDPSLRAQFLLFLTNVFHLMPEDALHRAIAEAAHQLDNDQAIYERVRERAEDIAPTLASVRFALPALAKQKQEIARETARLLEGRSKTERYVEIGTPGRYVNALRERFHIGDEVYLVHVEEPGMSPEHVAERGQLSRVGAYIPLANYTPLTSSIIPKGKVDLVTNYIGLHHAPREKLGAFVESIRQSLRPGGTFVLRDHDVTASAFDTFVALAHDVFNAGLGLPWQTNAAELRFFQSVDWIEAYVSARGFRRFGPRIAQPGDPTRNLLMAFERV